MEESPFSTGIEAHMAFRSDKFLPPAHLVTVSLDALIYAEESTNRHSVVFLIVMFYF